jgi:hypothetical protein
MDWKKEKFFLIIRNFVIGLSISTGIPSGCSYAATGIPSGCSYAATGIPSPLLLHMILSLIFLLLWERGRLLLTQFPISFLTILYHLRKSLLFQPFSVPRSLRFFQRSRTNGGKRKWRPLKKKRSCFKVSFSNPTCFRLKSFKLFWNNFSCN